MKKIKNSLKERPLSWYCFFLIVIKAAIAGGLFICALNAPHDDLLGVDISNNLLAGNWLGAYDNRRLVKGITFPVFLAVNNLIGLPYTMSITVLYGLSCIAFIRMTEKLIKNRVILALIFTILFFIPASTGTDTIIRVYRSSLTCPLVLLVFTCFAQMYFNRGNNRILLWSLISGVVLAIFWNLREDSAWIMPYILAATGVTFVCILLNRRTNKKQYKLSYLIVPIIPFLILILFNTGIRALNYHYYGTFTRNELCEGAFPKLLKTIYSIEPEEDIPHTSVPWSTIEKIFDASPSFDTLRTAFNGNHYAGWDGTSGRLDGEIEDGWFMWCLRDCIFGSGYDTAEKASIFCEQAANEIQSALDTGLLPARRGLRMPSALMSPWKDDYASELPEKIKASFWHMAVHEGDHCMTNNSSASENDVLLYEAITHNSAMQAVSFLQIHGWIVSMDDTETVNIWIYQNGTPITELQRGGGEDVYRAYAAQGKKLENALNSRFATTLDLESSENLSIVVQKNNEIIDQIPITTDLTPGTGHEGDGFYWHLDQFVLSSNRDYFRESCAPECALLNHIDSLYHKSGKWVTILGLLCYGVFTVLFLYEVIRKKTVFHLDEWLILSGLIGSVITLCIGIGYTEMSAYTAITPVYTSGGKTFLLAFNLLSLSFLGKTLLKILNSDCMKGKNVP